MKIVLDLRSIHNLESGDGRFSSQVIKHLASLDGSNKYILLVRPGNKELFEREESNFELRVEDIHPYSVREKLGLGRIINTINPDIYHTFTFSYPLNIDCKTVVSVYDVIHLVYPRFFSLGLGLYYKFQVRRCVKKASAVLTISEWSKSDIIDKFGVSPDKVEPVYCGVHDLYKPVDKGTACKYVKDKFSVSGGFMLYVGQIKKHKNIETLVHSLKKISNNGSGIKLVICGRGSTKVPWLSRLIREFNLGDKVALVDTPSDTDLLHFYNAADLFVYPSFYEGFGLPPLEAMSCGTPVVSSNASSLPEVLGEAARFVDPDDTEGLSNAITEILSDKETAESLSRKGLTRSKFFSWEKSAEKLLDLYKDLVKSQS